MVSIIPEIMMSHAATTNAPTSTTRWDVLPRVVAVLRVIMLFVAQVFLAFGIPPLLFMGTSTLTVAMHDAGWCGAALGDHLHTFVGTLSFTGWVLGWMWLLILIASVITAARAATAVTEMTLNGMWLRYFNDAMLYPTPTHNQMITSSGSCGAMAARDVKASQSD